ncbi:MYCBP-associated protein isoform X1 [Rhincodon typus]|uniref:MYCBP-associated protein isoform X1 n=1 Tax=Rhincodon typus TaxID=259920 RepID=UPI0020305C1A|nr:MYCBP-associated protein isoform X1 [Rhincodon typus]
MGTRTPMKVSRRELGLRTSPADKRKENKKEIEEVIPIKEEPQKEDILNGEDIMALAIKPEDLTQLHGPRVPLKAIPITSRMVVRKPKAKKEMEVKRLIAKVAPSMDELKTMDYSGPGGPRFDTEGRVLPHSILGTLADFTQELLARGLSELASVISQRFPAEVRPQELQVYEKKPKDIIYTKSQNQDHALANWQWHMAERKRTQQLISKILDKPVEELVMNQCENIEERRQQSNLIDQTMAALGSGKGYHIGSEFWTLPPMIGDELSGVASTLTQTERGFPPPIVHSGKPLTIKQETGTDFPQGKRTYRKSRSESLYLKKRLEEMKTVLKHLDFRQPDIDHLEVIATGRPFSSMSVESFPLEENHPTTHSKENIDLLDDYPDVIEEPIIGPSIMFAGHPARWLNDTSSHKDEVAMIVRLTFEAMAGDRVISCLPVTNDGTTVIYYKWKRLPEQEHCIIKPNNSWMQRFYFNTNSGVILPRESISFPFTFKSPNAGIFTEFWEFCTHPVVLGGACLQVALWGVALFEDKNETARQQLQEELEKKEKMTIIDQLLNEVIDGVRTPQRSQSPVEIPLIEQEVFEKKNPNLHYKYVIVQSLKELWKLCFTHNKLEADTTSENQPRGSNIPPYTGPKDKSQTPAKYMNRLNSTMYQDKSTPTKRQSFDEAEESSKLKARSYGKATSHRVEDPEQTKHHDKRTPTNKTPSTDEVDDHPKHKTRTHGKASSHQSHHQDTSPARANDSEKQSKEKTRSHGRRSARYVEPVENVKAPKEVIPIKKAPPPDESEPEWDLSIDSFRKDVLTLLVSEKQKDDALEMLNLKVLELSTTPMSLQENIFYKVLYQLWQETVDRLVGYSMHLREIMGLPEKESEGSVIVEETQIKKQSKKDDKKTTDKKGKKGTKSAGKEEEKEKRPSAKKSKARDDKKYISPPSSRASKQPTTSRESPEPDLNQEDPILQQIYREKLYIEVYGLIKSMISEASSLFEDLKEQDTEPLDKCV